MKAPRLGEMRWSIRILRRAMTPPAPWSAEVDHSYTTILTTRAKAETRQGVSEFNRVVIKDQEATHVFWIRYTTIPFDVRDRVQDTVGTLYSILSVENVEQSRRWMKIYCAQVGGVDRPSVT